MTWPEGPDRSWVEATFTKKLQFTVTTHEDGVCGGVVDRLAGQFIWISCNGEQT